jgi:two-component system, NarL family, invasion response regulator UvrY
MEGVDKVIKVLIAEDHAVVREGLKLLIQNIPGRIDLEETDNGNDTLELIRLHEYDLVILDISMPGMTGIEILQKVQSFGISRKILVLSLHPEEHYAIRCFNLGAAGYISKNSSYPEIREAILTVLDGHRYYSRQLSEKLLFSKTDEKNRSPHELLSEREFQVMILLAKGLNNQQISHKIFVAEKTVSTYRARLLEKMGLKTVAELTRYAIQQNLIS